MCIAADRGVAPAPVHVPISRAFRHALARWIRDGEIPRDDFLTAVLAGDLVETVLLSTRYEREQLPELIRFLKNEAPPRCWGSRNDVAEWMHASGLHGRRRILREAHLQ